MRRGAEIKVGTDEAWKAMPPLIRRREFAEWLGVHPVTVNRMARRGDIKVYAPNGRYVWYYKAELARILCKEDE